MNIKQYFYRRKLLRNNFFENVCCDNKQTEKEILYWMFWLHRKGISINKFSDLFGKFINIQFPIKVSSWGNRLLTIVDNHDDVYDITYSPYNYKKLETYSIGGEMSPFSKEITFQLTRKNEIILREIGALQLNEDNTNKEDSFSLVYDYQKNTTTAMIKQENSEIEIVYQQNQELDNVVLFYLFEIAPKCYFDDVFPILIGIRELGELNLISIKATKHSEISSELVITDGIVKKYSFTEKFSDSEVCLHQKTFSQNVKEFINLHLG